MVDWDAIDTILLDMDGTVVDLRFDTVFWNDLLPARYAAARNVDIEVAHEHFAAHIACVHGTLDYYCIDAWTRFTQLPVAQLKLEVAALIDFRPQAEALLHDLRTAGKAVHIVTNAHPASLALKDARLALSTHVDGVHSAHELGEAKESLAFWSALSARLGFDPVRTLFIDDTPRVLDAAHAFGIANTLQVTTPDSGAAAVDAQPPHAGLASFGTLIDGLRVATASAR